MPISNTNPPKTYCSIVWTKSGKRTQVGSEKCNKIGRHVPSTSLIDISSSSWKHIFQYKHRHSQTLVCESLLQNVCRYPVGQKWVEWWARLGRWNKWSLFLNTYFESHTKVAVGQFLETWGTENRCDWTAGLPFLAAIGDSSRFTGTCGCSLGRRLYRSSPMFWTNAVHHFDCTSLRQWRGRVML